ncbi:unnamed protein product [Miscanthus lutarioriparius]|uniref:Uncharacterized protein n=1 Tax=Miscanthus lutarioriparius TaxID=422564 RepID=A0A811N5N8_9POAL|nr:unnamed protein product [Miscanthus lutarioriparius]
MRDAEADARQRGGGKTRAAARARLTCVRLGKKKKASSGPPGESASAEEPVYLVVEHGVEEPTHSILELGRGTALGSWVLALIEPPYTTPKTFTEVLGPRLLYPMMDPILIPHGSELYALSRCPAVVGEVEFMPWFFVFDLNLPYVGGATGWREMPPPPIFPCRLNPLEYRNSPEVRVASYAMVGSHIVLSVQQDKGTCALDVDTKKWEMVDSKNLPFIGHAVPLGGHHFVACSKARDGAAAVFFMEVAPPEGKLEKARIVHRTYSQVEGDDARTNSVVIVKQQRQIYKLHDRSCHLAYPLPVVAALTL